MCNHRWGWESATSACLTHAGSGKINKENYLSLWRNFNCLNMLNFEYYSILLHFNFLDLPWEIQKKDTVCTKLLMCWRNICQNVGLGFSFNYISKGWQKWQTGKLSTYVSIHIFCIFKLTDSINWNACIYQDLCIYSCHIKYFHFAISLWRSSCSWLICNETHDVCV